MGAPVTVSLDVRNSATNGDPNWVNVQASNNQVYSFSYTGGTDSHGNVTESTSQGTTNITVNLICDARYQIDRIEFSNDPENQLSLPPGQLQARSAVIQDKGDKAESDAYYKVKVKDTTANCIIDCDPKISNVSQ